MSTTMSSKSCAGRATESVSIFLSRERPTSVGSLLLIGVHGEGRPKINGRNVRILRWLRCPFSVVNVANHDIILRLRCSRADGFQHTISGSLHGLSCALALGAGIIGGRKRFVVIVAAGQTIGSMLLSHAIEPINIHHMIP